MTVRVLTGDCREMLATLPDASVQCVVTSPPYYGLRDYGVDGQIGLEPSPDAYVAEMVGVFREVRRVLRDDGCVFLNLGDSYAGSWGARGRGEDTNATRPDLEAKYGTDAPARRGYASLGIKPKDLLGIPWTVAFALRADGWWLRSDIIWAKPNPMPESVTDRPTSAHEHVFLLSKRASYFWDAEAVAEPSDHPDMAASRNKVSSGQKWEGCRDEGRNNGEGRSYATRNLRNVWTIATQPYSGAHFATMPPDLAERCIKAGTSERGQCPYCGSPWARVLGEAVKTGGRGAGNGFARPQRVSVGGRGDETPWVPKERATTGWQPTCACPEHLPIPQTVLDPFAGAGTTLLVADRLRRNAIGIELNPAYARLARDRVHGDAPLFAEVAE